MKCHDARRHWDLYYDSEGDAELHYQLNEHIEECARCAQWFEKQSSVESLIVERLVAGAGADPSAHVDWAKILAGAGVSPKPHRRSWIFMSSALLALAASVLLMLGFSSSHMSGDESPSLSHLTTGIHQHVSAGGLRPEFESRSDLEVDAYLLNRVSFPVRCPPRKDSGFVVNGAGLCELASEPAAYVVGTVDQRPVSIFVLPRESLETFTRQRDQLRRAPIGAHREGESELVFSVVDRNVVLVVGAVERVKLMRVLKSYGTYPHAT